MVLAAARAEGHDSGADLIAGGALPTTAAADVCALPLKSLNLSGGESGKVCFRLQPGKLSTDG
jgi:hypothetical protein